MVGSKGWYMNMIKITILIFWISVSVLRAQTTTSSGGSKSEKLAFLMFNDSLEDSVFLSFWEELGDFSQNLKTKLPLHKSERTRIRKIFFLSQQKYLKEYRKYAGLASLIKEGKYDCISGSALLYFIFRNFGYEVEIWESPHHVYLLLRTEANAVFLVESTHPENGVLSNPSVIQKRIAFYRRLDRAQPGLSLSFSQVISIQELVGLQFYNDGVKYYNQKDFSSSQESLQKALGYYSSQRIKTLLGLCQAKLDTQ